MMYPPTAAGQRAEQLRSLTSESLPSPDRAADFGDPGAVFGGGGGGGRPSPSQDGMALLGVAYRGAVCAGISPTGVASSGYAFAVVPPNSGVAVVGIGGAASASFGVCFAGADSPQADSLHSSPPPTDSVPYIPGPPSSPQFEKPALPGPSRQAGLGLAVPSRQERLGLPVPSRQEVLGLPVPSRQEGPGLPVSSRQEAAKPSLGIAVPSRQEAKPGLSLGLPLANRQEAVRAELPPVTYVTPTVTTPLNRDRNPSGTRPRVVPVPLARAGIDTSRDRGPPVQSWDSGSMGKMPKWARLTPSGSLNSSLNTSGQFASASGTYPLLASGSLHGAPGTLDVANTMTQPSEFTSTISSGSTLTSSTLQPPHLLKFDSNSSFRWAPEHVCVQSWHRQLEDTYKMELMFGEGRHGAVFIVKHKRRETFYACKLLNKGDHDSATLNTEIEMMRKLDHPNIVRLYETNEDRESVLLIMELCQGGDLYGFISESPDGHLPEKLARDFAQQMLDALAYCHAMGVVHRDVKPENFLLETEDPACSMLKLADFGIATSMRFPRARCPTVPGCMNQSFGQSMDGSFAAGHVEYDGDGAHVNGSQPYMAPEMLIRRWDSLVKESNCNIERLGAGDLWSCGIVIYVMLSGDLPYGDRPEAICSGDPPDFSAKVWSDVSEEAKDLILKLLDHNVSERWTARQGLRHPWFGGLKERLVPAPLLDEGLQDWGRPASSNDVSYLTDASLALPENRFELGRRVLRLLRRWRRQPKLRRIVLSTIAKRLEVDHPATHFSRLVYGTFGSSCEKRRCDVFVHGLNRALSGDPEPPEAMLAAAVAASPPQSVSGPSFSRGSSVESMNSAGSRMSTTFLSPSKDGSITGFHIRHRVKGAMRRLSRVSEDTPGALSPPGLAHSPGMESVASEELVSLTELKHLVDSLDGMKNGTVDYTLLVAALLPPAVYCDDSRVDETFEQFDIRKKGAIRAEDLCTKLSEAVRAKETNVKKYAQMISEFDTNGDGQLDVDEFRGMLKAGAFVEGDASDLAYTPMTEPTPSCASTSRASPGTAASLAQTPIENFSGSAAPAGSPPPNRDAGMPPTASKPTILFNSPNGTGGYPSRP